MTRKTIVAVASLGWLASLVLSAGSARADGDLRKLNHVIIVMQENHSFDNYFGALPYVPGGPYHGPRAHERDWHRDGHDGGCDPHDHACVDGLRCRVDALGSFECANANREDDGSVVHAFHEPRFCTGPDLDHSWKGSHFEANFRFPSLTFLFSPNDGFVQQNDRSDQPDVGPETPTDDDTMGFYTQEDLPFYYALAQRFAIDDRYFCSVIGQTFPNRAYELAATSFGHLTTSEILPPAGGYAPITGTIFDLLDQHGVSWVDYFSEVPTALVFGSSSTGHVGTIADFMAAAAAGTLPQVAFVDPNFGFFGGVVTENDEHPPTNIRKGQKFVSDLVNAVRNGPNWQDSIVFVVYDEHGGFYDHVAPARAPQGGARNPDGIAPGQCADLSNPPASLLPGGGAQCSVSQAEALAVCPRFTATGPYPFFCPNFDQLGFRVPFIAVSPFSKPHYVSHTVGDHTSMLALIEKRFMGTTGERHRESHPSLTARDAHADTLEDMFDFSRAPSLDTPVPTAPDASPTDPGCPFVPPDGSGGSGGGTF
ncbi:MAG TPA: alkaline phosphatase family protein [Myxococcota bacterium]|nr:alkaline phosphatase family protein [Myxococcota bacterium]